MGTLSIIKYSVIAIVIAGGAAFHFWKINNLELENSQLTQENQALTIQDQENENLIDRLRTEMEIVQQEIADIGRSQEEITQNRQEDDRIVRENQEDLDRLRTENPEEYINAINTQVQCVLDHFDDVDGNCVGGIWVPDGQ